MSTILTIGDLHFKDDNLSEAQLMIDQILQYAEQYKPTAIVILGDILHYHNEIELQSLAFAKHFLLKLGKIAPLHILIGNHDRINNSQFQTKVHPFVGLKKCRIYYKAKYFTVGEYKCLGIPYVPNDKFGDALLSLDPPWNPDEVHFVFSHQNYWNIVPKEKGAEWPETFPINFSGHYHERKRLSYSILYIGAPSQVSYVGDTKRSISLIHIGNNSVTFSTTQSPIDIPVIGERGYTTNKVPWNEQLLYLRCICKINLTLSYEELLNWNPPDNYNHYKLKVVTTRANIKKLATNDKIQQLLSNSNVRLDLHRDDIQIPKTTLVDNNLVLELEEPSTVIMTITDPIQEFKNLLSESELILFNANLSNI